VPSRQFTQKPVIHESRTDSAAVADASWITKCGHCSMGDPLQQISLDWGSTGLPVHFSALTPNCVIAIPTPFSLVITQMAQVCRVRRPIFRPNSASLWTSQQHKSSSSLFVLHCGPGRNERFALPFPVLYPISKTERDCGKGSCHAWPSLGIRDRPAEKRRSGAFKFTCFRDK
jgi:hypothetical protein